MHRFVGKETISFVLRRQNVLAHKGDRLNSVFVALAGFAHPSLVDQISTWCKQVGAQAFAKKASTTSLKCRQWVECGHRNGSELPAFFTHGTR